jgi:phage baseplate assembly protein W
MKLLNGKHLSFPFRIGSDGRMTSVRTLDEHVRQELIQLLLTNPGERPFEVEFGGGVRRLVFEAADEATAAMAKARITQAVNRWLGHRVILEHIEVKVRERDKSVPEGTILVDLKYRLAGTDESRVIRFERKGG